MPLKTTLLTIGGDIYDFVEEFVMSFVLINSMSLKYTNSLVNPAYHMWILLLL